MAIGICGFLFTKIPGVYWSATTVTNGPKLSTTKKNLVFVKFSLQFLSCQLSVYLVVWVVWEASACLTGDNGHCVDCAPVLTEEECGVVNNCLTTTSTTNNYSDNFVALLYWQQHNFTNKISNFHISSFLWKNKLKSFEVAKRSMNDERWEMKDERWRMKDEGSRQGCFDDRQTDRQMNKHL